MVRMPGAYKTYDELETCLSLEELQALLEKARDVEHNGFRFAASLKGIDLDAQNKESADQAFARVERNARAKIEGVSEEAIEMADIGFSFTREE